jgi:hypothetical protein
LLEGELFSNFFWNFDQKKKSELFFLKKTIGQFFFKKRFRIIFLKLKFFFPEKRSGTFFFSGKHIPKKDQKIFGKEIRTFSPKKLKNCFFQQNLENFFSTKK